jgi:hypothetical protein
LSDANVNHVNNNGDRNSLHVVNSNSNQPTCMNDINFEIVGLFQVAMDGFAPCIGVCGQHVCVGDVLHLVRTVVDVGEVAEEAIILVTIIDGMDGSTVGFVPWVQSRLPNVVDNLNKVYIVQELYHNSSSSYKRKKGERNKV